MSEPIKWTNVTLKLSQLKKWENNPAEISKDAAGRLVECFNEFGQIETLAVDPENRLVDGHQRLDTWLAKYGDIEVDCRKASRLLTEKERQKIAVMLRSGAVGRYNWDVVSSWSADDLQGWGMDSATLKEWKHDVSALDNFIESEKKEPVDAEPQIDRATELNEKWQVKTGDLWQIGEHRLLCGDSTVKADVDSVMGGEKADACVTDPPYGVLDNEWDRPFSQQDLDMIFSVTNGLVACFNAAKTDIVFSMLSLLPMPERMGVWRYSQIMPRPGMIWSWQPVFYWNCKEAKAWDSLDWYQGNSDKDKSHPTQKPVEFFEKIIGSVSANILYEPFCGSGTTMVACENLHRKCRAIEISPNYCAVILERMSTAFPELEIKRLNE